MIPRIILDGIIERALSEDIGRGDITTSAIVREEREGSGVFLAKESFVLAGLFVARRVFEILDPKASFLANRGEGDEVEEGEVIAEVTGSVSSLLAGERVALNFLQRMSGIATLTRKVVELTNDYPVLILDTRKTTPGLRILEKYAVRVGGGRNHRFGLDDGVLIKDNHIKIAGGIREAISRIKQCLPHTLKIEVEVSTIAELREAIEAGADIVMLDNMSKEEIVEAVKIAEGRVKLEVSGGVNLDNVREYVSLGIDYISLGMLTHSFKSVDISFLIR
ncbi:MAG: carboxylating nicotinate-nucleotide diphosphorylase [Acidobacteria bacterium]|nr:carboxylating nicotinate-nucleotide diphosphorylase [Acidobacteriota bacterium]